MCILFNRCRQIEDSFSDEHFMSLRLHFTKGQLLGWLKWNNIITVSRRRKHIKHTLPLEWTVMICLVICGILSTLDSSRSSTETDVYSLVLHSGVGQNFGKSYKQYYNMRMWDNYYIYYITTKIILFINYYYYIAIEIIITSVPFSLYRCRKLSFYVITLWNR